MDNHGMGIVINMDLGFSKPDRDWIFAALNYTLKNTEIQLA